MHKSDPPINKKNVFSNFVYQTNYRFRKGFKSGSFVDTKSSSYKPIQDMSTQTNFCSSTTVNLSVTPRKVDIFRESCTQTSKTVITQDQKDCGTDRLSMDSLSPRFIGRIQYASGDTLEAEEPPPRDKDMPIQRKKDGMRFVNQCEDSRKNKPIHNYHDHGLLAGNALTRAYLEKNRSKVGTIVTDNVSDITRNAASEKHPNTNLKSKSYVQEKMSPRLRKIPLPLVRFNLKHSTHQQAQERTKPMNYFLQPSTNLLSPSIGDESSSRKNTTFMSPTISSESKDQSIEINSIQKLIAPTKKGRSPSPKLRSSTESKKVPYIDKSEVTIMMDRKVGDDEDIAKLSLKSSCNEISSTASSLSTESALSQAINKLRDPDWNTSLRGLAEVVEIGRILDSDVIYPHMTIINQRLIELIKSPRSHVSRTSCQAIGHLFEYVKDTRRPEFDELVDSLLFKCADSNKFIRHDANLALDCMVTHIPTFHSVRAICTKGPDHKNPLVRIATARLLVCAIVIAGAPSVLHPQNNEFTRRRIILNMTKFMNDRDAEVRKYGERVYKMLCKDRIFDIYMTRYLERDVITKMKKLIRADNGRKF